MTSATLYVVATPIGNLGDLTTRAREVLASVSAIACEDTRRTRALLSHFEITGKTVLSYYAPVEQAKSQAILAKLLAGESIALVSDAGTPCISDPGALLIAAARERDINVVPIPGPCAAIAALSVSGFPGTGFTFLGFPPRAAGKQRKLLQELAYHPHAMIFYEAPSRLPILIQHINDILGSSRMVLVARELTKQYETVYQGIASELIDMPAVKGEVVVVVEGARDSKPPPKWQGIAKRLAGQGVSPKVISEVLAEELDIAKREVYQFVLAHKDD